ncbi:MAG: hemin uptake protein HemP [Rhizobiaceae bacterium]|nr:hemin uptake protein HemP [Rhizobiaceae bacterium]
MNNYNPQFHRSWHSKEKEVGQFYPGTPPGVRTVSSNHLFNTGEHEIGIAHGESVYRLRITRQGKLILNK